MSYVLNMNNPIAATIIHRIVLMLTLALGANTFSDATDNQKPKSVCEKSKEVLCTSSSLSSDGNSDYVQPPWLEWSSVALSDDASVMAAAAQDGSVWITYDLGISWFKRLVGPQSSSSNEGIMNPRILVVSGDGEHIALAAGKEIWTSDNRGATWILCRQNILRPNYYWSWISISADGNVLYAISKSGSVFKDIWVFMNFSKNCRAESEAMIVSPAQIGWQSLAISSTGKKIVAIAAAGVWTSVDYGRKWKKRREIDQRSDDLEKPKAWNYIASSSLGNLLTVATDDGLWLSRDGGLTFLMPSMPNIWQQLAWKVVAMSSDGSRLVGLSRIFWQGDDFFWYGKDADIWVSKDSGATWVNRTAPLVSMRNAWSYVTISRDGRHLVALTNEECKLVTQETIRCVGSIFTSSNFGIDWLRRTSSSVLKD